MAFTTTKSSTLLVLALLAFSLPSLKALPYGDDNNDIYSNDDYEDDGATSGGQKESQIYSVPEFLSEPQSDLVNEGATIRLNCIVDRLEGFVLLWKRGKDIITVGEQMIEKDPRYNLEKADNGNSLVINNAKEEDQGNFTCQISTYNPTELLHTVKIRVRPEVVPVPSNALLVAKTGDSVTLECRVTRGDPQPEVTWHRRDRKMPSGEDFIRGTSFTYTAVTRHHSGNYICSADNGFGEPTETLVKLDVQHAPELEQEETFIHTGEGDETEIICVVHSSPRAEVTWYKDGFPIDMSDRAKGVISHHGNRHNLLIPVVDEAAFGDYTCKAVNAYGEAAKTTRVSGKAGEVTFKSDPKGPNYDRYLLEWTGVSSTPITHFRVQYKAETDLQWADAEIEAVNLDREFYAGGYTLPKLRPATVYLARVSSKNAYGYNDFGKVFKFATKGADPVQKPMLGAASILRIPVSVIVSTLCVLVFLSN